MPSVDGGQGDEREARGRVPVLRELQLEAALRKGTNGVSSNGFTAE